MLRSVLQFAALMLVGLVAGTTFGILAGYDPRGFTAWAFVEVHRGAVAGLNVLAPAMAAAGAAAIVALAATAGRRPAALWLYLAALVMIVAGGVITRMVNQPINAEVLSWRVDSMPADWPALRDVWWRWHVVRTGCAVAAMALLIPAIFTDRRAAVS